MDGRAPVGKSNDKGPMAELVKIDRARHLAGRAILYERP